MRRILSAIQACSLEAQAPDVPAAPAMTFNFITAPGMESLVEPIIQQLPTHRGEGEEQERINYSTFPIEEPASDAASEEEPSVTAESEPGLESQQQDQVETVKVIEERYQNLMDMLNPKASTGSVQVYLLDQAGMAAGHAGSQAALRALVRDSLRDKSKVVAALTSTWKATEGDVKLPVAPEVEKANTAVLKKYLNTTGVTTVESMDELLAHLNTL